LIPDSVKDYARGKQYGGAQYEIGGEYDLTEDDVNYILANGGQIEYLD